MERPIKFRRVEFFPEDTYFVPWGKPKCEVVGIILVIALLTVPPAISKIFTCNLRIIMELSILFGVSFSLLGLLISYKIHIASGASIIIVAVSNYIMFFVGTKLLRGKVKLKI